MRISIVMPAYNEEKRIGSTLESYSKYFEKIRKKEKLDYKILVVINNTRDNTKKVVQTWVKKNKRIRYLDLEKGGKGYAVIEGFKDSLNGKFDFIGFVDADGATPPESYYGLIKNIHGNNGIIASRYVKGAKLYPPMNFRRSIVGKTFHAIVRALFFMPFQDTQCGAKLFDRRAAELATKKVGMTQWAFDIEMLYEMQSNGLNIKEIPTIWKEVPGSKLKIIKTSILMFLSIIQLRVIKSPFRRLLRPLKHPVLLIWRSLK